MNKTTTTDLGILLGQATANIASYDKLLESHKQDQTVHVPNVANALLFAYEQLRNASENIEDQLLVQKAILRFYSRNLSFTFNKKPTDLGNELVIELTQSEYLKNDSVSVSTVKAIDEMIQDYYSTYWKIHKYHKEIDSQDIQKWILEILSVKTEQLFNNPIRTLTFAHFAHAYFTGIITYEDVLAIDDDSLDKSDYPTLLYISIHKAILKSDNANVRSGLLDLYKIQPSSIKFFVDFNKKYDYLAELDATSRLSRFISKNGATLRILRSTFFDKKSRVYEVDVSKKTRILDSISLQIDSDYQNLRNNLHAGIIRSIVFLLITKAIIGLMIEVPYDIIFIGHIDTTPLLINLFFPPVFLALTTLTYKIPGETNKNALVNQIKNMLYVQNQSSPAPLKYSAINTKDSVFNIVYIFIFIAIFGLVSYILYLLKFNVVQGLIFFTFLSTASFLSYRLTLQIKEIELVPTNQGFGAIIRDLVYAPFIFIGQKISYRFGKMNLIAQILDIIIDLPLKTTVRLIRQWMVFLNNKKDELM